MSAKHTENFAKWQEISSEVRKHRDDTIAQVVPAIPELPANLPSRVVSIPREYLTPEEIVITECPIKNLLGSLAKGEITSLTVTKAFLRRAAIAQKLVNCVYELLPERALARASELDQHFANNGSLGALHGLPISVKEHIGMKGLDNTAGFVGWVGRKNHDDASILKILLAAGAVLYVRTTEPQGLMMLETISNITGVTTNPYNASLTPGGSSGGEAALLALSGSVLGIGSDIGGSIRSPASCTGIYGLRPTASRLPAMGLAAWSMGSDLIEGTIGPMSPTLEGIDLFMQVALDSQPWLEDPSLHQVPWRTSDMYAPLKTLASKLTIGVIWDDGIVKPSPPITRAMREVVEKLKLVPGVEIIEWKPYQHDSAMNILTKLYSPDGGDAFSEALETSGEPWSPLTSWTLKETPGAERMTLQESWKWSMKRDMFRYAYHQEWNVTAPNMDVIICPVGPLPAPPHGTSKYWGYTSIWNLLDYPSIVFPVTKVDLELDSKDEKYVPRNDMDKWYYDKYDVHQQKEMPVGLQLVAKKMEDEKLLEAMRVIKEKIGLPFVDYAED